MSGNSTNHCVAIGPSKSDAYVCAQQSLHLKFLSGLKQSCVWAREFGDTPSYTFAIPICSKSSPRQQIDPFLLSFPVRFLFWNERRVFFVYLFVSVFFPLPLFFLSYRLPLAFPFLPPPFLFPASSFPFPCFSFPLSLSCFLISLSTLLFRFLLFVSFSLACPFLASCFPLPCLFLSLHKFDHPYFMITIAHVENNF